MTTREDKRMVKYIVRPKGFVNLFFYKKKTRLWKLDHQVRPWKIRILHGPISWLCFALNTSLGDVAPTRVHPMYQE
jgi:hypothetical protein